MHLVYTGGDPGVFCPVVQSTAPPGRVLQSKTPCTVFTVQGVYE